MIHYYLFLQVECKRGGTTVSENDCSITVPMAARYAQCETQCEQNG